jgi:hypothetical protein
MKKHLIALSVAGAALAFAISSTAIADTPPTTAPEHHEGREHHPAIKAAIRALERARDEMKAADHDFGGHRVDALAECDKAIEQLKLALQYDKK